MKQIILVTVILLSLTIGVHAQSVTGKILDNQTGEPLIGATIVEKGTTNGTISNFDGQFSLNLNQFPGSIEVSYVGFESKTITISSSDQTTLETIYLNSSAFGLDEVIITGVMDIVEDRQTPVAVSTIPSSEIQSKMLGDVDLPEAAKFTPSIYVTNQASGYGDTEVWTRGFDQTNTAFLLNGEPII